MKPRPCILYDDDFFGGQVGGSAASARVLVPTVLSLLREIRIESVVDFGCGTGAWLVEFQRHGIRDVLGIDGDYVAPEVRRIAPQCFEPRDLAEEVVLPRRYDLALSLEVGEHLPAKVAPMFVRNICAAADVVLFSACPPTPGHGTGHVNEQPQSYWAKLFVAHGFVPSSIVRDHIWAMRDAEWFYRQNVVLYLRESVAERYGLPIISSDLLDVYHPEFVQLVIAESVNQHSATQLFAIVARRAWLKLVRLLRLNFGQTRRK